MNPSQGIKSWPSIESYFHRASGSGLTIWYTGAANQTAHTTTAPNVDTLIAYPIVLAGGVLDTIAFELTTGGGGGSKARCGLYRNTDDNIIYPSTLVVDGGEFATTVGLEGVKSTAISVAISPGLYWFAYLAGVAAPTVRAIGGAANHHILGIPTGMGSALNTEIAAGLAYAALPATFTAGGTLVATTRFFAALHYSS